jgi:hypothetical protein
MPALTRRKYPERPDCWHVYSGDVHVGTIVRRAGVPVHVDQWEWRCGFDPRSHRGVRTSGTAADFEGARVAFETGWTELQPRILESDYHEHRRQRAGTAWKYAMWAAGCLMPTQKATGRSRYFCGAEIDIKGADDHVVAAHLEMQ